MWIYKLVCVFILAAVTVNAERYYESESNTTWRDAKCKMGEPQLSYNNGLFVVNETLSSTGDVWIGYLYAKVPFLLLGCARLQSVNGVYVNKTADCFTICKDRTFGIQRTSHVPSGLLCICVKESLNTSETSCIGGDQTSLCNNCSEIYTQINVTTSHVSVPNNNTGDDCLTYYYPNFTWGPCLVVHHIKSMCSNATYADLTATATMTETNTGNWMAGNKLCLTNGRHPSFQRSITNAGFSYPEQQYYWTGIFRANVFIKLSLKDFYSCFSTDRHVFANRSSMQLWVAEENAIKRALCINASESTSRTPETSKNTITATPSFTTQTYPETIVPLTEVTTSGITTTDGSKTSLSTTQIYTTRHQDTTTYTAEVTTCATTEVSSKSSLSTTQLHTILATDYASQTESSAVGVSIGASVGILLLVGGAVVIIVLRRRGMLNCNRKTENNKPSKHETAFRENMTYGKSIEDNVANHNYFILEKCEQFISNNAEHCTESNEANTEDDYNTIHDTEEPFEHVQDERGDYYHTTIALPSGPHARKPENIYNKLKIDRQGDDVHVQRHGLSVVKTSEDDYDTTSAVVTHGMDDISDYNHIPRTAYKACATGDNIKGIEGGNYDAINNVKFKVIQSDSSDYAQVNKDRIK